MSDDSIDFEQFLGSAHISLGLSMKCKNLQVLSNLSKEMTAKNGHGCQLIL
jgi:hypothetical protein